jgi:hypothetical protein
MTQLFSAKTGDLEQAKRLAEEANASRVIGFSSYHFNWNIIKQQLKIPPAISGLFPRSLHSLQGSLTEEGLV